MKLQSKLWVNSLLVGALAVANLNQLALADDDKIAEIDGVLSQYHQYQQFNGTALVVDDGKVLFKKGYGLANMEWDIANQPDTKFRIASVTKQFTAMLIMQLVQEGKIKLHNKISDYLPGYRKDLGDKITVHHLLTHTAGLPNYTSFAGFMTKEAGNQYSVDEFVEKFCSRDLEFEPGSKFAYSNSGYFVLGAIIEKVSGQTYAERLRTHIFEPIGMKNSGYDLAQPVIKNRAAGYEQNANGYINTRVLNMSIPFAAGAMYSTVEDMYLWDRALYGEKLLSNKYKQIMFTPFLQGYAYGWGVNDFAYHKDEEKLAITAHNGGINGFSSLFSRFIEEDQTVILLNNTGGAPLGQIQKALLSILHDKEYEQPKQSIAKVLYQKLQSSDIKTAVKHYHHLKQHQPDGYNFHPHELNMMGYQLLSQDKQDEALAIFKLNTQAHPQNANAFDSLGEAYMRMGKTKQAIMNYKKSLELDPSNTSAKALIAELKQKL